MPTAQMASDPTTQLGEGERTPKGQSETKFRLRNCVPYLIFTLCASLYFLPFMRLLLRGTDEGTLVEGAVRTVHGQLLGRDFFEVIGPGTFYWLALFFKLFGVTFLASRICLFITSLATALSLYFLSRRVSRKYQALPCILLFGTYFGALWPTISHHVDSNCSALLAVVCIVLWRDAGKNWLLLAAGALTGATTLILQPKGLLLLLAISIWLWIQYRKGSASLSALLWIASGTFGVIATMLGYFWSQGALGDLIYANVVWPSRNYETANSVLYAQGILSYANHWIIPMRGINWTVGMAAIFIIPFVFVAALPALVLLLGRPYRPSTVRPDISLYLLCGCALWFSELHRKDICHLVYGSTLLVVLSIFYLQQKRRKLSDLALQVLYIASVCLASFNLIVALFAYPMATRVGSVAMGLTKGDPVLSAIEERVPADGELFVYPYSPMYYFLSATNNPTRYSFLVYSYYTPSQFRETVNALEQHRTRYVLWDTNFQDKLVDALFPAAKRIPPSGLIFESYLKSHYKAVWIHDGILLMERNNDDHRN